MIFIQSDREHEKGLNEVSISEARSVQLLGQSSLMNNFVILLFIVTDPSMRNLKVDHSLLNYTRCSQRQCVSVSLSLQADHSFSWTEPHAPSLHGSESARYPQVCCCRLNESTEFDQLRRGHDVRAYNAGSRGALQACCRCWSFFVDTDATKPHYSGRKDRFSQHNGSNMPLLLTSLTSRLYFRSSSQSSSFSIFETSGERIIVWGREESKGAEASFVRSEKMIALIQTTCKSSECVSKDNVEMM